MNRRPRRLLTPAWLALGTLACSYQDSPDFRGEALGELKVIQTFPAPGQLEVGTGTWIDLIFNLPLQGESVANASDFRLFSGLIESYGKVQIDLLESRLRFIPREPLRPRLRYQTFLWGEVRGVNGARLGDNLIFDFTVGTTSGQSLPAPAPAPSGDQVQATWNTHCTGCHGPPSSRAGLDLSTSAAARATLAGVPSDGHPTLYRVLPGDHARSYLMRKLLGQGIAGMMMPPTGPSLTRQTLRWVADWIDAGAQ